MRGVWGVVVLAVVLGGMCAPGCGTGRAVEGAAGDVAPADFSVSLSVYKVGEGRLPGWYVVGPEGQLRAVVGERRANTPLPPIVRQLDPADRERLWGIVRDGGLLGRESPEGLVSGAEDSSSTGATATIAVSGGGRRVTLVAADEVGSLVALEAAMRELAWLSEGR